MKNFEFFTKLINGKYPDYERVIPKDLKQVIKLNRDKMIEGMKTISIISELMKITFEPNSILFESVVDDNSEAKTTIEFNTNVSESFSIGVKNRYLLDFLAGIEDSEFELGFNDAGLAFVVSSKELKTVIMPINV